MKLEVSKIRGVTSYGMLCSEAELKLSDQSDGIISLDKKYNNKIGYTECHVHIATDSLTSLLIPLLLCECFS